MLSSRSEAITTNTVGAEKNQNGRLAENVVRPLPEQGHKAFQLRRKFGNVRR